MDSILLNIKAKLTDLIPNSSRKGVFFFDLVIAHALTMKWIRLSV